MKDMFESSLVPADLSFLNYSLLDTDLSFFFFLLEHTLLASVE